jgi:hypothetical protein
MLMVFARVDNKPEFATSIRVTQELEEGEMFESKKDVEVYNRRQTVEDGIDLPVVVVVFLSQDTNKIFEVVTSQGYPGDNDSP